MGIGRRLARLEQSRRSCPECGQPANVTHDATHIDSYEAYQEAYKSGEEFCEACGRRVLYPVYFHLEKAATTLPAVIVRARPKEVYVDGD
jgi:hypothetical protein